MSRKRTSAGTAGAPPARGAPSGIAWRVREPVPKPLSTSLLGLGMFAGATLPFAVMSVAVVEVVLRVDPHFLSTLSGRPGVLPSFVQTLLLVWVYTTPFFAGFILRGAIPRMYPRFVRWIPPVAVRIGIYSSVVVCAGLVLVVLQSVTPGWRYMFGLIPVFITVQLWAVLRLPELARVHAELDRVWF